MDLSDEQKAVVDAHADLLLVNAFAGAGKTSTIMEYIKARPKERILTLVFNKSASLDMQKKALKKNVVTAEFSTIHAFAYRNAPQALRERTRDKLLPQEMSERFRTKLTLEKRRRNIAAKILIDLFAYWCKSRFGSVDEFFEGHVPPRFFDVMERTGVNPGNVQDCMRLLETDLMDSSGEIPITHDAYLKWFELTLRERDPLPYDEIIVDEAQDTTDCTLALVLAQEKPKKVFVGDRYQQIYGWNDCINSFSKLEGKGATSLNLSQSFRCPDSIAGLARPYLSILGSTTRFRGCPQEQEDDGSKAVLCRTNAAVVNTLIKLREMGVPSNQVCLYGGVKGYNFEDIFDIARLADGETSKIRSPEFKGFQTLAEYAEYVEEIGDFKNKRNIELVTRFGTRGIFAMRGFLVSEPYQDAPVPNGYIVSTAHKSKGSEFSSVDLAGDFLCLSELLQAGHEGDGPMKMGAEDLRLLYVALTRAKRTLSPESRKRYGLGNAVLSPLWKALKEKGVVLQDVDDLGEPADVSELAMKGLSWYAKSSKQGEK